MVKKQYNKTRLWIERKRFTLLLLSTLMTIVLPAFANSSRLSDLLFVITLSFLFIQSTIVADVSKSKKVQMRVIVISMFVIIWLKPAGYDSPYIDLVKLVFIAAFFIFVMSFLIRFIVKSGSADLNVLLASINIYLLAGIVGACLCLVLYNLYPDSYNFPAYISNPQFVHFLYYSFITMSTVGYGDIVPRIPETQTMSYILSIAGQLYVAIVIALLIGKFLMESDRNNSKISKDLNV
jgi:voltage-gated potassium channel